MNCPKCKKDRDCLAGCSAHSDNWYCSDCDYQQELEAMPDVKLNRLLDASLGYDHIKTFAGMTESSYYHRVINRITTDIPDYCNSPNTIMPLVIEHKINLIFPEEQEYFIAEKISYHPWPLVKQSCTDKNPLRAVVICLLLIDKEENK